MEQNTSEAAKEYVKAEPVKFEDAKMNEFLSHLEPTDDEREEAEATSGQRGQIKKILRPYYDDHLKMREHLSHFQKDLVERTNRAIGRLDYKNREMYSGLVKWVMNDLGTPVSTTYVNMLALIDEVTTRLYSLESGTIPLAEYKEKFDQSIRDRAKAIEADLQAKKELKAKENAEKQMGESNVAEQKETKQSTEKEESVATDNNGQ